ncbi:hypothetical protein C8R45DRAFT_1066878 [Mycena sanguinolenta]|nr:hypothetical protein C8R45DRAFT_1066878 [Mycena sanguinolenta]
MARWSAAKLGAWRLDCAKAPILARCDSGCRLSSPSTRLVTNLKSQVQVFNFQGRRSTFPLERYGPLLGTLTNNSAPRRKSKLQVKALHSNVQAIQATSECALGGANIYTATGPSQRPPWQKLTARQLKEKNLGADPIYEFIISDVYPLYREAELGKKIQGTRETYTKQHLFPIVDKQFDISGPKGYDTGVHYESLPHSQEQTYDAEVSAATKAAFGAHGIPPSRGESTPEVQANMEADARLENERRAGNPPSEHIVQNQVVRNVERALRELMGNGRGGHGRVVFHVRGAYRDKEGRIRQFEFMIYSLGLSIGSDPTVIPFVSAHKPDVEADFKRWAQEILVPQGGAPPRLQGDCDSVLGLPEVNIDAENTAKEVQNGRGKRKADDTDREGVPKSKKRQVVAPEQPTSRSQSSRATERVQTSSSIVNPLAHLVNPPPDSSV